MPLIRRPSVTPRIPLRSFIVLPFVFDLRIRIYHIC
jgi:hypothetical protein